MELWDEHASHNLNLVTNPTSIMQMTSTDNALPYQSTDSAALSSTTLQHGLHDSGLAKNDNPDDRLASHEATSGALPRPRDSWTSSSSIQSIKPHGPRHEQHFDNVPQQPFSTGEGLSPQPGSFPGAFTKNLIGSLVASASKLNDTNDELGVWFVLQDLSVRTEGGRCKSRAPSILT